MFVTSIHRVRHEEGLLESGKSDLVGVDKRKNKADAKKKKKKKSGRESSGVSYHQSI